MAILNQITTAGSKSCMRFIALSLTVIFIACGLAGCAAQGPPGGGPVDSEGPRLLSTLPENGATNLQNVERIELLFSEPIDPRSAEGALQVTPRLKSKPIVHVQRRRVIINLSESLQAERTYIFSFSRNLRDYQQNYTPQEIRLAFSTGDSLDDGSISGQVFDIPPKTKVLVWLFLQDQTFPDSLLASEPDFSVAVDPTGHYAASNLPVGVYRALAVAGTNPRPKYLTEEDFCAVTTVPDVALAQRHDRITDLNFRLSRMYQSRLRLTSVTPATGWLELNFNHNLSDSGLHPQKFSITGTSPVKIAKVWWDEERPAQVNLIAQPLADKKDYHLKVTNLGDDRRELLKESPAVKFTYLARPDTIPPKLARSVPPQNSRDVPTGTLLFLHFTEPPIFPDTLAECVTFFSGDSVPVDIKTEFSDDNTLVLRPKQELIPATAYKIRLSMTGATDLAGNVSRDSLSEIRFTTLDHNLFGIVSGNIVLTHSADLRSLWIEAVLEGERPFSARTQPDSLGNYLLPQLLPGKYTFRIWEDRDGNGRFDFGRLLPYQPSEPYRAYPQTVNVRSRWETAEVNWSY